MFTCCGLETWKVGCRFPIVQLFFACYVSPDGLIYVAEGQDDNRSSLQTADTYDVKHDKWEVLPPMSQERDRCHGAIFDGKFTVISGYATESQGRFEQSVEVFDHNTQKWSKVENMWSIGGSPRSCLVAWGHLYVFRYGQVMRYNGKENVWEVVASLPDYMDAATCGIMWRDKIFVSGSTKLSNINFSAMLDSSSHGPQPEIFNASFMADH